VSILTGWLSLLSRNSLWAINYFFALRGPHTFKIASVEHFVNERVLGCRLQVLSFRQESQLMRFEVAQTSKRFPTNWTTGFALRSCCEVTSVNKSSF